MALQKPDDAKYTLQKWSAGSSEPKDVLVFDDLVLPNKLNELINFAVDGDTLIFDDHGAFWMASLTGGGKAKWVKNSQEIGGLAHDAEGVIYNEDKELWRYTLATDTRENLSERIRANPYQMKPRSPNRTSHRKAGSRGARAARRSSTSATTGSTATTTRRTS